MMSLNKIFHASQIAVHDMDSNMRLNALTHQHAAYIMSTSMILQQESSQQGLVPDLLWCIDTLDV